MYIKNIKIKHVCFFPKQELCLNIIPTFANLIEYPSMKNALIPRIKSACLQTSSLAVCVLMSLVASACTMSAKDFGEYLCCLFHFSVGCRLSGEGELFGVPRQDSGIPG